VTPFWPGKRWGLHGWRREGHALRLSDGEPPASLTTAGRTSSRAAPASESWHRDVLQRTHKDSRARSSTAQHAACTCRRTSHFISFGK
jgi:hypothetical protein